jgi:hypothetical protein
MYPIERRLHTLKNSLRSRSRPKGSIAEAYLESESLTFCERYIDDVETRYNHDINLSHDGPLHGDTSLFMHGVISLARLGYSILMISQGQASLVCA